MKSRCPGIISFLTRGLLTATVASVAAVPDALGCTSAIVSGSVTADGRPILWKNRDTGHHDNFMDKVEPTDTTMGFVALFNAGDSLRLESWIGVNDAGFAIMNTQSYNLPDYSDDNYKDREGYVMTQALKTCRTAGDFAVMLAALPRPMDVQANFGVLDANGDGGYFECDDFDFVFTPVTDENPVLIRTNFSVSAEGEGMGRVRYHNAQYLLAPYIDARNVTPEVFTECLSRSFYRSDDGLDHLSDDTPMITDRDFIPRYSTSATVAVHGVNNPSDISEVTVWANVGYPPAGVTYPCTLSSVPDNLLPQGSAGVCAAAQEANRLKRNSIFKGKRTIRLKRLIAINEANRAKSLQNYSDYNQSIPHK